MKLPGFKKLISQDYEAAYKKLIETLAGSLNYGIEVLYNTLNNGVTLRENMSASVKDVTLTTNSSGFPIGGASFKLDFPNKKLEGVMVISALNQVNSASYPTSGVFISVSQLDTIVTINHVTGLQPGISYTLRVVAFLQ